MPAARKPVVTLGPIATPVVRTTGQVISGEFLVRGVELFLWTPSSDQRPWLVSVATVALSLLQNWIEKRQNRKLVGVSKS